MGPQVIGENSAEEEFGMTEDEIGDEEDIANKRAAGDFSSPEGPAANDEEEEAGGASPGFGVNQDQIDEGLTDEQIGDMEDMEDATTKQAAGVNRENMEDMD